ncbi:MAG: hypothetical protein ACOYXA_17580 [Bacteroidota bacterium]
MVFRDYGAATLDQILFLNLCTSLSATMLVAVLFIRLNCYIEDKIQMQNEMLKRNNADLDRFVYSASHDLRAPSILCWASFNWRKTPPKKNLPTTWG